MKEAIDIPRSTEKVAGYLKTPDGIIILSKEHLESFEIARKLLNLFEKRLRDNK